MSIRSAIHAFLTFSLLFMSTSAKAADNISEKSRDFGKNPEIINNVDDYNDQREMNVYFLSGLGADERVFAKLRLDTTRFKIRHIKWIRPLKKEKLPDYAKRLSAQIDTTRPFHLVGLSFGGIMASVLSDIIHPEQIVIISSTSTGVPVSGFYQNLIRFFLFSPLSGPILKSANSIVYDYFGANTPEMKALLKQILSDTDTKFLKWALKHLSSWHRNEKVAELYHIHGTADKLIPIKLVKPDVEIPGGGHLMIFSEHEKVSSLLNNHLKSLP